MTNINGATVASGVSAMQARLDALKGRSFKASDDLEAEARIAREILEHIERLDREGAETLGKYADKLEAEARARLGPSVSVSGVYKWEIHKATADKAAVEAGDIDRILETGKGLIIVRGASDKAAVKCAEALGAAGSSGRSGLFVNRPEDVEVVIRGSAVWPTIEKVNDMIADKALGAFLAAAAREAADLGGAWASTTQGKSKG